jgi:voltage-gated potassium channel Kch
MGERVLGRFGYLLIALVFFLATTPLAEHTELATARFQVMFTLVLLVGVYTLSGRRSVIIGSTLAALSLLGSWLESVVELGPWVAAGSAASAVFLSYVAFVVLVAVLRELRVTTDTVLGGICVYFLIGIIFALLYSLVIELDPDAILLQGAEISAALERGGSVLLYYSFVTLTTLGYGDVIPQSNIARMLAGSEAVIGQLFIAVLIARLVGMHISSSGPEARS